MDAAATRSAACLTALGAATGDAPNFLHWAWMHVFVGRVCILFVRCGWRLSSLLLTQDVVGCSPLNVPCLVSSFDSLLPQCHIRWRQDTTCGPFGGILGAVPCRDTRVYCSVSSEPENGHSGGGP